MKEVKLFQFRDYVQDESRYEYGWQNDASGQEEVALQLAKWLNDGWQIAGTGGEYLAQGFVILSRQGED